MKTRNVTRNQPVVNTNTTDQVNAVNGATSVNPVNAATSVTKTSGINDAIYARLEDPAVITKLENLIGDARAKGYTGEQLLSLYPDNDEYQALVTLYKTQRARSVTGSSHFDVSSTLANKETSAESTVGGVALNDTERLQLKEIMQIINGFDENSTEAQIQASGLSGMISLLSPQQLSVFYLMLNQQKMADAEKLRPTSSKADVDPSTTDMGDDAPAVTGDKGTTDISSSPGYAALTSAEQMFKDSKYSDAYKLFDQALQQDPTLASSWPDIYYNMGVAAEYSNDPALLLKAQENFEKYLKTDGVDAKTKAWIDNELKTGIPSQIALQKAGADYDKKDYDAAFKEYQNALKADPTLSERWPTILYQLGSSAEDAKDTATNKLAGDYYKQYLKVPNNDDKQTIDWVTKEIVYLGQKDSLDAAVEKASDEMNKESEPDSAEKILKQAIEQNPEAAKRQPDVYFTVASYAYAATDISTANDYLDLAESAMNEILKQDPSSKYATEELDMIHDLQKQTKDPWTNLTKSFASLLGDKLGGRAFWAAFMSGVSTGWFNKGRIYESGKTYWESSQIAVHGDLAHGVTYVKTDGIAQKTEFDRLNSIVTEITANAAAAKEELKAADKALADKSYEIITNTDAGKDTAALKAELATLQAAADSAREISDASNTAEKNMLAVREHFTQSFETPTFGMERIGRPPNKMEQQELYSWDSEVRGRMVEVASQDLALAKAKKDLSDSQKALEKFGDGLPETKTALEKKVTDANAALETAEAGAKRAKVNLENSKSLRQGLIDAAQAGKTPAEAQYASAEYIRESYESTAVGSERQVAAIQEQIESAKAADKPAENITALETQLTAAKEQLKADEVNLDNAVKHEKLMYEHTTNPALSDVQTKKLDDAKAPYEEKTTEISQLVQEQQDLVKQLEAAKAANLPTGEIENKLKAENVKVKKVVAEGEEAQAKLKAVTTEINDELSTHETTSPPTEIADSVPSGQSGEGETGTVVQAEPVVKGADHSGSQEVSSANKSGSGPSAVEHGSSGGAAEPTSKGGGVRKTLASSDKGKSGQSASVEGNPYGPGWWGVGDTLDHQQAAAFQWSLGAGADGKITSNWRGPFDSTSKEDPTTSGLSIYSGGEGTNKYNVNLNGGVNIGNVEHRDYYMVYGGSAAGGVGIGGMIGTQVRADVIDETFGVNYQGGDTTIGGQDINNMVTMSASENGSVGVQTDASVGAGFGRQADGSWGGQVDASAGYFAGAQVSGQASGAVDGVGVGVMGQAWAGEGAKVNADVSYKNGKLGFDIGIGAALGVGAYVDFNVTIDFNAIGNEIKGVGTEGVDLAKKCMDKMPTGLKWLGATGGFIGGALYGAGQLAEKTGEAIIDAGGHISDIEENLQNGVEDLVGDKMHLGILGRLGVRAFAA
ncbi:MAG: hypothetical protein O2897_00630, partial [bacterium]|nr:hypothetical protein [bacterium]